MRWLITGASGFTGSHLTSVLRARGESVTTLGRSSANDLRCDLMAADEMGAAVRNARPDRVVHLAAISAVVHQSETDMQRVNVVGTENLLRACSALSTPPFLALASSAQVYGAHEGPIAEHTPPRPASAYGRSKLQMEAVAREWAGRLPLLIVRPFNYTGPGQPDTFLIPKIAAHFRRAEPVLTLGDVGVERDFSDVRDIIDDYLLLFERAPAGTTVNLCSGRPVSGRDIIDIFVGLTGHRPQIRQDTSLFRQNEITSLVGNPSELIRLTGRAHQWELERTLAGLLG